MADPVFDEDYILHLLALPVTVDCVDGLQAGAAQALIDLYDRKVTRDEFIENFAKCLSLYSYGAKLNMLHSVKARFDDKTLTENSFKETDARLCDVITKQAQTVAELMKRLKECPTSVDKIH